MRIFFFFGVFLLIKMIIAMIILGWRRKWVCCGGQMVCCYHCHLAVLLLIIVVILHRPPLNQLNWINEHSRLIEYNIQYNVQFMYTISYATNVAASAEEYIKSAPFALFVSFVLDVIYSLLNLWLRFRFNNAFVWDVEVNESTRTWEKCGPIKWHKHTTHTHIHTPAHTHARMQARIQ